MKKNKTAFITGISGQDGSYLAEYLLELGYDVHGSVRRNSVAESQTHRINGIINDIHTYYADVLDEGRIRELFEIIKPDEIYNLAAQSHVRVSFDIPAYTLDVNAKGALNVFNAAKDVCPEAKVYQASSSEMFGNSVDPDGYQRETTQMVPVSPYGSAKLCAFNLSSYFKNSYNMHICNGILFNHESPRRGSNFVTNKVVKSAVEISKGFRDSLNLGNISAKRDWGHSKDYVKAMYLMLNDDTPDNYVVSTGEAHSVEDLVNYVFDVLNLNYKDYVKIDESLKRPNELHSLKGDSSKIRGKLGWEPSYTFESMLNEMIEFWDRHI